MTFWEFLDNLFTSLIDAIVEILICPLGWIGLLCLKAVIETLKG